MSAMSDHCSNPRGRRSPYVWAGTLLTIIFMTLLPCTEEICEYFFEETLEQHTQIVAKGLIATALIWALNLAIQPVQMGLRALVCEACPAGQNVEAAAYASTMTCIGSIVGYSIGYLELPRIAPAFGDTQFKCVCLIAASTLATTTAITLIAANEIAPYSKVSSCSNPHKAGQSLRYLFSVIRSLPNNIKVICWVQFFGWLGWFPFLYYITT
jgi:solute carrier family 45 protein 1/2/4